MALGTLRRREIRQFNPRGDALGFAVGQAGDALGIPTSLGDVARLAGVSPGQLATKFLGLSGPQPFLGPGEFSGLAGGAPLAISPLSFLGGAALTAFTRAVFGPKNDPFLQADLANNALLRSTRPGPSGSDANLVTDSAGRLVNPDFQARQLDVASNRALGVGLSAQGGDARARRAVATLSPRLRVLASTPGLRFGGQEGTTIGQKLPGQRFKRLSSLPTAPPKPERGGGR